MPITKIMRGLPSEPLAAEGLMYQDLCLTACQRECCTRLGVTMQIEQEAYMTEHPEVKVMLELFMNKIIKEGRKKNNILRLAGEFFTKPAEELDKIIREKLGVSEDKPYTAADKPTFKYEDKELTKDLKNLVRLHSPPERWMISPMNISLPNTPSSSFLSIITSDTTLPTPEPIPTPEPTVSETLFGMISFTVDKAIYLHVDERALRYDTAYVELMKCVEEAMEIPVLEIKNDIAELFFKAYRLFEIDIMEKERIAAEIAWEKRMRKKLKRTLRRQNNFKGYETPPTPKSEISSHESYKKPPQRPCPCFPQFRYNRYPKDRFGIYLPFETEFSDGNVTATPAISLETLVESTDVDTKSVVSSKSNKSAVSKKTINNET